MYMHLLLFLSFALGTILGDFPSFNIRHRKLYLFILLADGIFRTIREPHPNP
jgi:hypothetical protein